MRTFFGALAVCIVTTQGKAPPLFLQRRGSAHSFLQQPLAPAPAPALAALPPAPAVAPVAAPGIAPPGLVPPAAPAVNPCEPCCAEAAKTYKQYRKDMRAERKAQKKRIKKAGKHHSKRVKRLLKKRAKDLAKQTKDAIQAAATVAKQQLRTNLEAFATQTLNSFSESLLRDGNVVAEQHAANQIQAEHPLINPDEVLEAGFGKGKDAADKVAVEVQERLAPSISNVTTHFLGALAAWENTSAVANRAATGSVNDWQTADDSIQASWASVRKGFLDSNHAMNSTSIVGTQLRMGLGMGEVVSDMSEVAHTRVLAVSEDANVARQNADTILQTVNNNKGLVDALEARINEVTGRAGTLSSQMRSSNADD